MELRSQVLLRRLRIEFFDLVAVFESGLSIVLFLVSLGIESGIRALGLRRKDEW
ncbi:MAG: hypothetical protein ABC559_01885 [Candidatus Methanosuratincola petrocarbonis]